MSRVKAKGTGRKIEMREREPVKELVKKALNGSEKAMENLKEREERRPMKDTLKEAIKGLKSQEEELKKAKREERKINQLRKNLFFPEEVIPKVKREADTLEEFIERAKRLDERKLKKEQSEEIGKGIQKRVNEGENLKEAIEKEIKEIQGNLQLARRESYPRTMAQWESKKEGNLKKLRGKLDEIKKSTEEGKTTKEAVKENMLKLK